MELRVKTVSGTIVILSGLPAWAQSGTQTGSASKAASVPDDPPAIKITDPGWFIAGFVTGLVVGVVVAKVFGGGSKSTE